MSISGDIAAFIAKLDSAIDSAMQGPVLDEAKEYIQRSAFQNVYNAYSPLFYSRRMSGGGIGDQGNLESDYSGKTLVIQDVALWQQLYGGARPGERLAEAIASGSSRYHFHRAGPRSFMPEAERDFAPRFEDILSGALRASGFKVY